jgi:hypothetical protein
MIKNSFLTVSVFLVLSFVHFSLYGSDQPQTSRQWMFVLAPYLWFVGLGGDLTASGLEFDAKIHGLFLPSRSAGRKMSVQTPLASEFSRIKQSHRLNNFSRA